MTNRAEELAASVNSLSANAVFTATDGQTSFVVGHKAGHVMVTVNGATIPPSSYFSDGTSINLVNPSTAGDLVHIMAFDSMVLTDDSTTEIRLSNLEQATSDVQQTLTAPVDLSAFDKNSPNSEAQKNSITSVTRQLRDNDARRVADAQELFDLYGQKTVVFSDSRVDKLNDDANFAPNNDGTFRVEGGARVQTIDVIPTSSTFTSRGTGLFQIGMLPSGSEDNIDGLELAIRCTWNGANKNVTKWFPIHNGFKYTTLYNGRLASGTIPLAEEWNKFDELIFYASGDSNQSVLIHTVTYKAIYDSLIEVLATNARLHVVAHSSVYWGVKPDLADFKKLPSSHSGNENGIILRVLGVRY